MMGARDRSRSPRGSVAYEEIVRLVVGREQARQAKDWAMADSLRERLTAAGVTLFDKTSSWRSSDGQTGKIPAWSDLEGGQAAESLIAQHEAVASAMLQRGDAPEGSDGHIKYLVQQRERARASKDWAQSDRIREELQAMGVEVIDNDKIWRSKSGSCGVVIGFRGSSGPSDLEISTLVVQREKARQNSDYGMADMIREELKKVGVEISDRDKKWNSNDGRQGPVPTWQAIMGASAPAPPQAAIAQPNPFLSPPVQSPKANMSSLQQQLVQAALAAAQDPASAQRTLQILQQAAAPPPIAHRPAPVQAPRPMPAQPLPTQPAPKGAVTQEAQEGIDFIGQCKADGLVAQDAEIDWLVSLREKCRANKEFTSADELRNHMRSSLGVELHEKEKKWVASDGRQGAIPMWGNLVI